MANRKLRVTPSAIQDLQDGIAYYNTKQKGLGKRFENTVHETLMKIQAMPQAASMAYSDVRYKTVEHFPFIIIYDFDAIAINVLRVFNTHLDPNNL